MIVYHGSTEIVKNPDIVHSKKYLDFVCSCRKGHPLNKVYDIIIGNVADDDVFKNVDMYFRGGWNRKYGCKISSRRFD